MSDSASRSPRKANYRDSHGKSLEDYPRPSVAVDTAVLTVTDDRKLCVLLVASTAQRGAKSQWRLPGTFLHPGETLADAVLRSLREKAGIEGLGPRQLHVFDAPDRDDRGWVLSVAHLDVVRADRIRLSDSARLAPIAELPPLLYDHREIVTAAVAALREEYDSRPDPRRLLGAKPFTIRDLQLLHEAISAARYNRDTFRRTMTPQLTATGKLRIGARGKPAELFRR